MSDSLQHHELQHARLPCHSLSPRVCSNHVHWISDAIQPSYPLSPPSPLALDLSQHQSLSSELALVIRWPKYWRFSFSISPSNEYSGLFSFRIDWFDLLAVHGTLKSLLQHHSSKTSVLSLLYGSTLTSIHDYWENHSFWLYKPLSAKWSLSFLILCLGLSYLFFQGASIIQFHGHHPSTICEWHIVMYLYPCWPLILTLLFRDSNTHSVIILGFYLCFSNG